MSNSGTIYTIYTDTQKCVQQAQSGNIGHWKGISTLNLSQGYPLISSKTLSQLNISQLIITFFFIICIEKWCQKYKKINPNKKFSFLGQNPNSYFPMQQSSKSYLIDNTFFDQDTKPDNLELYLIILNQPFNWEALYKFSKMSTYSIVADGAANRLFDLPQEKRDK